MKKVVELRKTATGNVILSLHFENLFGWPKDVVMAVLKGVVSLLSFIFQSVDKVSQHHSFVLLLGALGLGFGMSLPIFASPDLSWASSVSVTAASPAVHINQIMVNTPDHWISVIPLDDKKLLSDRQLAYQISVQPLVIQGNFHSELAAVLKNQILGAKLTLLAENGGRYHYGVTELRQIKAKELPTLVTPDSEQLFLVVPTDLTQQSLLVIVAQRQAI